MHILTHTCGYFFFKFSSRALNLLYDIRASTGSVEIDWNMIGEGVAQLTRTNRSTM